MGSAKRRKQNRYAVRLIDRIAFYAQFSYDGTIEIVQKIEEVLSCGLEF